MKSDAHLGEVLFELVRIGNVVKVSAIHVETNIEVSLACPASLNERALKWAAMRKLTYVLGKLQNEGAD